MKVRQVLNSQRRKSSRNVLFSQHEVKTNKIVQERKRERERERERDPNSRKCSFEKRKTPIDQHDRMDQPSKTRRIMSF